jgi:hypothetical protein
MAFTSITKPAVGDPTRQSIVSDVIDNLNDLNVRIGSGGGSGLSNPSFESDNDADGEPDSWTITETGGTQTIEDDDNTEQAHGAASIKFTYPASASGGGYFETTDFYECAAGEYLKIAWKMLGTSATGAKHIVRFYWFKWDQSASSTASTDAYSDTFNPTAWTQAYTEAQAPSDAKYFKVRFIASDTSATPSGTGSISFDDVRLVSGPDEVFSGKAVFEDATGDGAIALDSAGLIWVECVAGGGAVDSSASSRGAGGGELAAGYFAASAATEYLIDVGAGGAAGLNPGGNSTFNSTTIVATGGGGGTNGAGNNGDGGTGGTGTILIAGQDGEDAAAGYGGHSARSGNTNGGSTTAGRKFGGGAAGQTSGSAKAGGDGRVIVWFNA